MKIRGLFFILFFVFSINCKASLIDYLQDRDRIEKSKLSWPISENMEEVETKFHYFVNKQLIDIIGESSSERKEEEKVGIKSLDESLEKDKLIHQLGEELSLNVFARMGYMGLVSICSFSEEIASGNEDLWRMMYINACRILFPNLAQEKPEFRELYKEAFINFAEDKKSQILTKGLSLRDYLIYKSMH